MQIVSAGLEANLRTGIVLGKAEVWSLESNAPIATIPCTAGSITCDRGDVVRRRANIEVSDTDGTWVPTTYDDYLSPGAVGLYEIRLFRGLRWRDSTGLHEEYVQQGRFRTMDFDTDDSAKGMSMSLSLVDRSDLVSQAKIEQVYVQWPNEDDYATAIKNLIRAQVPSLTEADFNFTTSTVMAPRIILEIGADPWAAAIEWAKAIGCELYVDANGIFVLQPEPDPTTAPVVASYVEGAGTRLLGVNRRLTRERTRNRIVVSGESSALLVQVSATATDTDPASPTYYGGRFGKVPDFITTPLVTTTPQATAMAQAELLKRKGLVETVRFDQIVHPGHEPGDLVNIVRARSGVGSNYMLERFEMPLFGASMQADTRERIAA